MRNETKTILDNNFNEEEKELLSKFADIISSGYKNRNLQIIIWEYDQSISGLGGYAFPLEATMNPCNEFGKYRNVFRSLQYARCDMYNCARGRTIINDSGLHIETLIKLINDKNSLIPYINNRRNLGSNLANIEQKKIISKELSDKIRNLLDVYNFAKHDTDESNNVTFSSMDSIIFYFTCRKLGNSLLKILKHPTVNKYYNINYIDNWEQLGYTGNIWSKTEKGLPMMDFTEIILDN